MDDLTPADIAASIVAKSDQLNADDLIGGPLVGRIVRVTKGSPEQPINVHLDSWPRPWRPCKSDRRILVAMWGSDARAWVGQSVRLYRDPSVRFGTEAVGGIRIEAASIDKPLTMHLTSAKGKRAARTIAVLRVEAAAPKPAPNIDAIAARLRERGLWEAAVNEFGDGLDGWDVSKVIEWAKGRAS